MLQLTYPGVYTEEQRSGGGSIVGASTSIAHFIGPTRSGIDRRPIRCLSFGDYERCFGGLYDRSSLSYSVLHFFANGGSQAVVTRLPADGAVRARTVLKRDGAAGDSITLTALGSGTAGNDIFVEVDPFDLGTSPFAAAADPKRFNLTVLDTVTGRVERFGNLTTASGQTRTADLVVNDPATGSQLVELTLNGLDAAGPQPTGSSYTIGTAPVAGTFAADNKLRLSVSRLNAAGAADDPSSIIDLEVTVFAAGEAQPTSPLELAIRLAASLNKAIRNVPAEAAKLAGAEVVAEVFEAGRVLRLSLSRPAGAVGAARVHDATVTFRDVAAGTNFRATYGIGTAAAPAAVANPSRYRLGQPVTPAGTQVTAVVAGANGQAHGQPNSTQFKDAITALETPDPFFNLLCLPDLVRPSAADPKALQHQNALAAYAEAARVCGLKHAFLLVDPPPDVVDVGSAEAWKTLSLNLGGDADHAGAWFPRIRVDDPLSPGAIISHPPSGAMAGVIARTDAQVGVWQAPAGTDAGLAGVYGPSVELSDSQHGLLNPIGVNVIRKFPIYQTVAFGSRTVAGANVAGSEWKYVPVRRTADYILRSLSESLRWAVHKPNGEELWSQLRVSVTAFMQGLFRQGAFKGTSARQAYFVLCDASTTPPAAADAGECHIVVGFAPLKPAEFVIITLRQIVQPAS